MFDIGADIDEVLNAARKLMRSLDESPKPTTVTAWVGPPRVAASDAFTTALVAAGEAIGVSLQDIMELLNSHAESLKAVAVALQGADDSAGQTVLQHQQALASARDLTRALDQVERQANQTRAKAQQDAGVGDVAHSDRSGDN